MNAELLLVNTMPAINVDMRSISIDVVMVSENTLVNIPNQQNPCINVTFDAVEIGSVEIPRFFVGARGDKGDQGLPGVKGDTGTYTEPLTNCTLLYTNGILTSVNYLDGSTKLFTYSNNKLVQVDYSSGILNKRKSLLYANDVLISVNETII